MRLFNMQTSLLRGLYRGENLGKRIIRLPVHT